MNWSLKIIFGLTFMDAESKWHPWTSVEQCGHAAFWEPPAYSAFFCHKKTSAVHSSGYSKCVLQPAHLHAE